MSRRTVSGMWILEHLVLLRSFFHFPNTLHFLYIFRGFPSTFYPLGINSIKRDVKETDNIESDLINLKITGSFCSNLFMQCFLSDKRTLWYSFFKIVWVSSNYFYHTFFTCGQIKIVACGKKVSRVDWS